MGIDIGGCVGLSIPDQSNLNQEAAVRALRILWGTAAEQVLRAIPSDGTETGATFSRTAEDYAEFEAALVGTGVRAEILMEPPTREFAAKMKEML